MGQLKTCKKCGGEFPLSMFHKDKTNKDGCVNFCKECAKEKAREWNKNNKSKKQELNRKLRYGLDNDAFYTMLHDQHGHCLVCERHIGVGSAVVDHDHSNGEVRGLLCSSCNTILGLAKDDPNILINAVEYLNHNNDRRTS